MWRPSLSLRRDPPSCILRMKHSYQPSFKNYIKLLTGYTSFHDLINIYSLRSGADKPRWHNFDVNRNFLSLQSFATKRSLWTVILYIFYDCTHVYRPGARTDNPLGTKFWCQQEHLVTSVICCKFQKNIFEAWFYTFFHVLLHVYSPGAGADSNHGTNFWCQQKGLITLPICWTFQRNLLEDWFYTSFHDLTCT